MLLPNSCLGRDTLQGLPNGIAKTEKCFVRQCNTSKVKNFDI